ncbi:DNA helicase-2/ATP-dependent DNA helicase PcrA [Natranaerovirga hydrolytica]|uniref:ATP-dependent DNA helicase n=1 Tax=Natranaerovirga hydrolytica TaxID=680378 RepID=A0A4R1MMP1_9FIRM|nr:DNA helicase PcrA [Natranaerovirga hydrolytica]TCK92554.1 DNA helicase-2/ATP-dependent DNA helicase PcrA [Natranaerovirga hydrolytica]
MNKYDSLNPMQKEAVLHTEGPLLILAGAGSGKTRVLTHRISYLLEEKGVMPWNILAITFTNKAAKEMRERVDNLIGFGGEEVWVSTFHSTCVRILRRHIDKIGYDRSFTIYDTDDQKVIIRDIIKQLNLDKKLYPERSILSAISSAKNEMLSPEAFEKESVGDFRKEVMAKAYKIFQKTLKKNNALDFDDLINKTVELFVLRPDVLEEYQDRFRYIMIDEYQDTNKAQYEWVRLLSKKYRNLCVVGDDDQSIYKFRGADIQNILGFEKDFTDAKVIKLEQNYRSTKKILEAANEVISNNYGRKNKTLWTGNDEGELIESHSVYNEREEAEFVANTVIKHIENEGKEYSHCAVLYRTNAQSRVLEEQFVSKNIPYKLVGGVNFYQRKEIKDVLSYLKTINNSQDDLATKRIINVPRRGIGQTSIDRAEEFAIENDMNFYDAIKNAKVIPSLKRGAAKIEDFVKMIETFKTRADHIGIVQLIEDILNVTGYRKELKLENTPEAQARIENIDELISKAAEYEKNTEVPTLGDFLEEVALVADIDNMNTNANSVTLMTLHSAKGLEFPIVFLTGMEEGLFPSYMSLSSGLEEDLEEERRLCYVGITRAEEKLYLLSAKQRMIRGQTQYNSVSRFLREIPKDLLKEEKVEQTPANKAATQSMAYSKKSNQFFTKKPYEGKKIPISNQATLNFQQGDTVKHLKFGTGKVMDIKPGGADYQVTVNFDKVGEKKLFASLAKLKKVE